MKAKYFISVIGGSKASAADLRIAEEVGGELARAGAAVVCGGLGGVMEAACKGAADAGGLTIGILPGEHRESANPYVQIPIVTGLGFTRNSIVAKSGQAVIAIGGSYGTLSEIAYARISGLPVIGIDTWKMSRRSEEADFILRVDNAREAVRLAIARIEEKAE
ncbi:TIGR00725 family protein [Dehalogenimonas alkenigignens]|uniref:TIGR00725 family protein n=1 Tax=Dehalogenimonas alkenigignens TaxID=1217799 RepID=A0A0W0GIU3_9CHLR|nr:TIGR00725 family protein [Dehalogenimonas alkenigignens]KTB48474.1 TIGR00725 family protein [Dehalogenimonas alkenigignens]PVV85076.1 TIGR00725 family protein [Dehalogenimonas alkenigignens]